MIPHAHRTQDLRNHILTTLQPGDPEPQSKAAPASSSSSSSSTAGFGVGLYAVILIGGAIAYGAYNYLQAQQQQQ